MYEAVILLLSPTTSAIYTVSCSEHDMKASINNYFLPISFECDNASSIKRRRGVCAILTHLQRLHKRESSQYIDKQFFFTAEWQVKPQK